MSNPLLDWESHPDFDALEASQIAPGVETLCAEIEAALGALESDPGEDWASLATPYYALQDRMNRTWGLLEHVSNVRDTPTWREAYASVLSSLSALETRLSQSRPLYEGLSALLERADALGLDEAQRRALASSVQRATLSGVGLPETERSQFAAWQQELTGLYQRFSNNEMDEIRAWRRLITDPARIAGLPKNWRARAADTARRDGHEAATAEDGPWAVGLDWPSASAIFKHCEDRALREETRRALGRVGLGSGNAEIISRILEIRAAMAEVLGMESYAELSLATKTAASVDEVDALLDQLLTAARPADVRDHEAIAALAAERGAPEADELSHWDTTYWFERYRESHFGLRDEDLRPYFSLGAVLQALFDRIEALFGLRFTPADGEVAVWHPDVRFFRAIDADSGAPVASLYVDPYVRPEGKRSGAWMNNFVPRQRRADGSVRQPVICVVCNQTPPTEEQPSLMTFREVKTLFHEFGHALQGLLTEQDVSAVAGTNGVEWDVVEVPSTFMENWCYHLPTLRGMARHYETDAPLPEEMLDALLAARGYRAAGMVAGTVRWSKIDMELHHRLSPGDDPMAIEARIRAETDALPPLEEDRYLCSFGHIFATAGYAAGYYSYLWAEVMSADAFAAFLEAPEDEAALGRRFRQTFLALGGGRHPADVFRDFRGRAPTPEAMLANRGLIERSPA